MPWTHPQVLNIIVLSLQNTQKVLGDKLWQLCLTDVYIKDSPLPVRHLFSPLCWDVSLCPFEPILISSLINPFIIFLKIWVLSKLGTTHAKGAFKAKKLSSYKQEGIH